MSNANTNSSNKTTNKLVSSSIALYLTAGVAPGLIDATSPYAVRYFTGIYGYGFEEIIMLVHGALVAFLTFLGIEKSTALMIILMSAAIGRYYWRFMGFAG